MSRVRPTLGILVVYMVKDMCVVVYWEWCVCMCVGGGVIMSSESMLRVGEGTQQG